MEAMQGYVNVSVREVRMREHGLGTVVAMGQNGSVQVNDGDRVEVSVFPTDQAEARALFEQLEPVEISTHRISAKDWHTVLRKQLGRVSITVHVPVWTNLASKAACHAFWMGEDA